MSICTADHSKKAGREKYLTRQVLQFSSNSPPILLRLAHTMSSEENHASSSVSQCTYQDVVTYAPQTTQIKKEPTETQVTLGPSSSFRSVPSEPMRVKSEFVKSESNEFLAKVNYFFLHPRLVVDATSF